MDVEAPSAVEGFTFTHGCSSGVYTRASDLPFRHCDFVANASPLFGGGVHGDSFCDLTFTDCRFANNEALKGGAILGRYTLVACERCTFVGNHARGEGGAFHTWTFDTHQFVDCSFEENSALHNGGVMCLSGLCSAHLFGCSVTGNLAGVAGGGFFLSLDSIGTAYLEANDSVIRDNTAPAGPDGHVDW